MNNNEIKAFSHHLLTFLIIMRLIIAKTAPIAPPIAPKNTQGRIINTEKAISYHVIFGSIYISFPNIEIVIPLKHFL